METIKTQCAQCGIEFERRRAEHNRSKTLGRREYCSRSCVGKAACSHLSAYNHNLVPGGKWSGKPTPLRTFRRLLNRGRQRGWPVAVSPEHLVKVWEAQNRRCVYTGAELTLGRSFGRHNPIHTASIDRIDATRGYVEDNVQIISIAANLAKGRMTHDQMIDFCRHIAHKHSTT